MDIQILNKIEQLYNIKKEQEKLTSQFLAIRGDVESILGPRLKKIYTFLYNYKDHEISNDLFLIEMAKKIDYYFEKNNYHPDQLLYRIHVYAHKNEKQVSFVVEEPDPYDSNYEVFELTQDEFFDPRWDAYLDEEETQS